MLSVTGFSLSVLIGLKRFRVEKDVYGIICYRFSDVRVYDVRND